MKSQTIANFPSGSEHIYCILDLEDEVHTIWVTWTSDLQECKGDLISKSSKAGNIFQSRIENFILFCFWGLPKDVGSWPPAPIHLSKTKETKKLSDGIGWVQNFGPKEFYTKVRVQGMKIWVALMWHHFPTNSWWFSFKKEFIVWEFNL